MTKTDFTMTRQANDNTTRALGTFFFSSVLDLARNERRRQQDIKDCELRRKVIEFFQSRSEVGV